MKISVSFTKLFLLKGGDKSFFSLSFFLMKVEVFHRFHRNHQVTYIVLTFIDTNYLGPYEDEYQPNSS
jgi:hypothetical protein